MPKSRHAYNCKIKTPSLSLPIHQSIYAWKNISPYFFCWSTGSLHTCDERFFNTPSLLQRNSETLWPPEFLTFYKSFTNWERTPLTFYADLKAHWANIFSLLLQVKKKVPHFTRDFRSTLTTLKSFFLQIVHIRTQTRLKDGSLETFSYSSSSFSENPWFYWGFWVFLCTLREGFLANFSLISRIFCEFSNKFRVGSMTIRDNLIALRRCTQVAEEISLENWEVVNSDAGVQLPPPPPHALECYVPRLFSVCNVRLPFPYSCPCNHNIPQKIS